MTLIRKFDETKGDRARVLDMGEAFRASSGYCQFIACNRAMLDQLITLVLNVGIVFILEVDGVAHGFIGAVKLAHPMSGEDYVEEVAWWVDPSHRIGRGGILLLNAVEDWASGLGVNMVKMIAPSGSDVGRFLERRGYQAVETAYIRGKAGS